MSDLLGVAITGVSGRMGQMLVETVHASDTARLVGALERPGHPWVGQDLGRVMQKSETGLIVQDKAENLPMPMLLLILPALRQQWPLQSKLLKPEQPM